MVSTLGSKNPSISVLSPFSTIFVVVGLVPSVCVFPGIKSGSFTSIKETVLPVGTCTTQSPFSLVSTTIIPPLLVVI